jgi:FtsP/CotA-like multicopper oxidase with cupredoxin domain
MIGTATIGTTLTKMIIDGFLIDKYELQQGVFGNDGNFYYPTWFNHQIETFSTEVVNDEGEPETVYDYNITINVQDKVEGEVYNYTLINTGVSQTSNVFTQLPAGTYTIMAESPLSMPYYETIVIPEGYIIPTAL